MSTKNDCSLSDTKVLRNLIIQDEREKGLEAKEEIIKIINRMSGKYSPHSIFNDWIECASLSIQNSCVLFHDELWQKREKQYISIMKKYNEDERLLLCKMNALLCKALEERIEDVLGYVYMQSGCYNKHLGQFFTPFHLSKLTADLSIPKDINEDNVYEINEPSAGGGGMIIAVASILKERGVNYQKCMRVTAQDLDWMGVYMSYLQFSYLGINAEVAQGDTLCEPYRAGDFPRERVFYTPKRLGVIL